MSDLSYKFSQDKHLKYYDFYKNSNLKDKEYWGLGIENESYLMFEHLIKVDKNFILNNQKRERYSVDYWVNFKKEELKNTLEKLPDSINVPIYLNGYLFQKTDLQGEPITRYTKLREANPKFNGETIEEYLKNNSSVYNKLFDKNMIYDGDTFEFTTYDFYKSNVKNIVNELINIKQIFITEINDQLYDNNIFIDKIIYPKFNYGFAKFRTNMNNIAICNNGTYHINITLPTALNSKGCILDKDNFKKVHSNAINAIQWFEPFLVGLYGSPDIFHMLNNNYSGGSLRLMMSRYIGLGTYDTNKMIKGKMLNDYEYKSQTNHYFNKLHEDTPYNPPEQIGYDINYNKFSKHGIEIRIFDYFPEEYLEDIINFIILICQYSYYNYIPDPKENENWNNFVIDILKNGSSAMVPAKLSDKINSIFGTLTYNIFPFFRRKKPRTILHFMNKISGKLYNRYKHFPICTKMSPAMKEIKFVDYNSIIKEEFIKSLKN